MKWEVRTRESEKEKKSSTLEITIKSAYKINNQCVLFKHELLNTFLSWFIFVFHSSIFITANLLLQTYSVTWPATWITSKKLAHLEITAEQSTADLLFEHLLALNNTITGGH